MSVRTGGYVIAGTPRTTGGVDIGDMGFAPLGIDESLNLRRYLNGQVISQTHFVAFTTKVKSAVALFPSLATTESNWQSAKTLSKFGQVGKFVIDDDAGTIRLPAVVNPQGLLGLSGIGNLVNESLPNITGYTGFGYGEADDRANGAFGKNLISHTWTGGSTTNNNSNAVNIDASRSSSTYQDSAPVQQEAIQYPYYIQVATGVEETLPAIREYKTNVPYVLGDSKYFEANPYNASWLVSNGQYNAKTTYPDMWTQLQVELNSSLNEGDTVVIDGKTYVKRGLPVVLSTDTITDYDFVVNQDDQTFRLPLKTKLASGSAVVGNGRVVGLTGYVERGSSKYEGALGRKDDDSRLIDLINNSSGGTELKSTNIGSIGTVQTTWGVMGVGISEAPEKSGIETSSNGLKLYYYVGDTVQDASLINAGAILNEVAELKAHTIVETYRNGTEWYRLYADGWCEQGGYVNSPVNNSVYTITLLIPYKDTNYTPSLTRMGWYNSNVWGSHTNYVNNLTASSFEVSTSNQGGGLGVLKWEAKGYIV